MKKISVLLFISSFTLTYLYICYMTSMRIKLAAPPMEYFIASISHAVLFKSIISFAAALVIGAIPLIYERRKCNK